MSGKTGETGRKPLLVTMRVVDIARIGPNSALKTKIAINHSDGIKMHHLTLILQMRQGFWGFT